MTFSKSESEFLDLIYARCLPRVLAGEPFTGEMAKEEMANELAFEAEMVAGKTDRARRGMDALIRVFWTDVRTEAGLPV